MTFTLLVPRYYNSGKRVPPVFFEHLETYLATEFGGFTRRDVGGGWLDPAGLLSHDVNYEYTVWGAVNPHKVKALAKIIKAYWKQTSVGFLIDNKPYYV